MRAWVVVVVALSACQDAATVDGALDQQRVCNELANEKQRLQDGKCGDTHRDCLVACPDSACRDVCNSGVENCIDKSEEELLADLEDCNPFPAGEG